MRLHTIAVTIVVILMTNLSAMAQTHDQDMGPGDPPEVGMETIVLEEEPAPAGNDTAEAVPDDSGEQPAVGAEEKPAVSAAEPSAGEPDAQTQGKNETFSENEIMQEVEGFFGTVSAGLGKVVSKVFKDLGQPNAIVKGSEAGGAFIAGLRYGEGTLRLKKNADQVRDIFWQGPSIGFDFGGNAAKVFMLVYDLPDTESVFRRYPGVEGSAYFVGGVGVTYLRSGPVVLAPIRTGVGWRLGANVGYLHVTPTAKVNPF